MLVTPPISAEIYSILEKLDLQVKMGNNLGNAKFAKLVQVLAIIYLRQRRQRLAPLDANKLWMVNPKKK